MKTLSKLVITGAVVFVALQGFRPAIPVRPVTAEVQAPTAVRQILDKSCYSCHSDQRRLAWFDEIVPAYWLVRKDILTAREHLNFSTLGSKPAAGQKATLYEAVNMIQLGAMPLPRFTQLHPEAKVTPEELATLKAYLAPWSATPTQNDTAPANAMAMTPATPASMAGVQPELNGFPFDPAFESWRPISFTDRGDNYTFRFILGNDIAATAAQSGNISPWPDGTRFAKIAWQQELGTDGLVHAGKFVQVELMVKDAQRYKDTDGWGWGRWRGADLKPYGKDAHFVSECTTCHLPVRGNDFVYTLPITAAKVAGNEIANNNAANLPVSLPYQPLGWSAITMYVDPRNRSMATLYGNDAAMHAVQAHANASSNGSGSSAYPAGAVLALVTWAQRDDPHWFGARIPDTPLSVEFVHVGGAGEASNYRSFAGTGLIEDHVPPVAAAQRTSFILNLAPAWLP
jgi:mono/diheme cytochrome c family protein